VTALTVPNVLRRAELPAAWRERFSDRIEAVGDCWHFTGYRAKNGYGHVALDGKVTTAHRLSCALATGTAIPRGHVVMHSCDNPPCVRPDHLRAATASENMQDMIRKRRHGHVTHPERMHRPQPPRLRGEQNSKAILTDLLALEIRVLRIGRMRYTDLARLYGVGKSAIAGVVRGESWSHLPSARTSSEAEICAALLAAAQRAEVGT
jgi:hypothetical protein